MTNRIRRALAPAAIAALAVLGAAPATVLAQDAPAAGATDLVPAEKLFEKHLEAIGGRAKVEAMKFATTEATVDIPAAGMSMTLTVWHRAPDSMRMSMNIPGMGSMEQGFDGETGWAMSPMTGPMLLEGPQLEDMKQQAMLNRDAHWSKAFKSYETTGEADFNGKKCWAVKAVTVAGMEQTIYFDQESGLQQGFRGTQATDMGELEAETVYKEWAEHDGVKMPSVVEIKLPAMGMTQTMKVTKMTFDEIPAEKFELPEMIRKLKEAQTPAPTGAGG